MSTFKIYNLHYLCGLMLILSVIAQLINYFIYQFPGNNFFPDESLLLLFSIILINIGLVLLYGTESRVTLCGVELFYFFLIMVVITLATNAIQYTPFPTIDQKIVSFEQHCNINMNTLLTWTHKHPRFKNLLGIIYDTLPYQMSLLPLLAIITGKIHKLREYYFLLLCTTFMGFIIYYFFPTTAPASIIHSPYFSSYQLATGIKFNEIHQHIIPSTKEGGLIAFPSFHTVWALLGLHLVTEWPIAYLLLLLVNIVLVASCVLLGWHYCSDLGLAFILLSIAYYLLLKVKKIGSTVIATFP